MNTNAKLFTSKSIAVLLLVVLGGCRVYVPRFDGVTPQPSPSSTRSPRPVPGTSPSALSYSSPTVLTRGQAMPALIPQVMGGVDTYSVSPALPTGLQINAADGVISGIPGALSARQSYVITARNSFGSTTFSLQLEVREAAPQGLLYASPVNATVGMAISPLNPTSLGGMATSYAVSPALPAGLMLNTTSGVISGTPTAVTAARAYTITASNSGGSASFALTLAVVSAQTFTVTYASPQMFVKGTAITPVTPSVMGGTASQFSVAPALPAGLSLSATSGAITGTPTAVSASATYTVTARTAAGVTATAAIVIEVRDLAPTGLRYTSPVTLTRGTAMTALSPTVGGGVVTTYSVSPALPSGLMLNASTGVISGTPSAVLAQATYRISARNATGSSDFDWIATVRDAAPANLMYSSPQVYRVGVAITALTPASNGGAITQYTVSPSLPAGLSLNASTGVISGTPTAVVAQANYTITGSNGTGSATFALSIRVDAAAPPTGLTSQQAFVQSQTRAYLQNNCAGCHGGANPPPFASANESTAFSAASARVDFMNAANSFLLARFDGHGGAPTQAGNRPTLLGYVSEWVRLLNAAPPSGLSYPSPLTLTRGSPMPQAAPTVTGQVTGYAVSPALPAGITLSAGTGILSGTPTEMRALGSYTITASNANGSTTFSLVLEVRDLAPATLSYSSPLNLLQGQAMVALNPAVAGGTPTSYMVSPSLPAGLSLHPTTGVISGTPSMASAEAQYLITAANATGSAAFTLRLAVLSPTALALNYPVIPALMRATAMSAISPVIAGSQVGQSNLFSVSPALPSGLSLNSVSGVISGTPSAMSASARHTITLVQGMRSATATVDIEVRDQAPLSLTYPAVLTLTQGVDMMSVSPSSTGGAITQYAVSPSLPAGVNLNLASGVLSGRPSLLSGRVNYVITGSNASGSASATIAIEVVMGSGGPAPGGTTVLSRTYEQSGLFGYLQMRCASCHGVSQIPRFAVSSDVDASAIAAWAKVNPTAPEQSILVVGNTGLGSSFVGGANFHASDRPTPQDRATILPYVQEWIRLYNLETGTGVAHGTARVRTAYEYFYGFGRVTGANLQSASSTDGITASARQSYDSARLRLPRSGAPDGLSGTTFAAYVNMVGAACLKFVETERALPMGEGGGRKAFIHVDFTRAPTDPLNISKTVGAATVDVRREMVIKLFEVFLQRAPSTEELAEFTGPSGAIEALVSAGWSSIVRTDASKMARTAQYACAIVAGSAESLIHR